MSLAASAILLFLAGVLCALGFEPFHLWPAPLLACAWLIQQTHSAASLRTAVWRGWLFGLGQFLFSLDWIAEAFTHQAKMPVWLGYAGELLVSLYLAIYPAIACGLAWWAGRRARLAFVLYFATAWLLSELLRATVLTGFPWNPLGVAWLPLPRLAAAGSWVGAYGLSAMVILGAGAGWMILHGERRGASVATLSVFVVPLLAWTSRVPAAHPSGPHAIFIRVEQPNISQDEMTDPQQEGRNARLYASLSGVPGPIPRLLLWPEGAANGYLQIEDEKRLALGKLLGPRDVLLIGGESAEPGPGDEWTYFNSVFALDHNSHLLWHYDKSHLVPFGEYLPWRPVLSRMGLSRLVAGEGDFSTGPGPRTLQLPGFGRVGVQICYEIIFSGHVVDRAHRPDFIFNPSDDAWFGPSGPPQHLAQARLRAIEEGLPVVRATPTGISAVIDSTGALVATVAAHKAGAIAMMVPLASEPTPFARLGLSASAMFGAVLCVLAVLATVVGRRRATGPARPVPESAQAAGAGSEDPPPRQPRAQ